MSGIRPAVAGDLAQIAALMVADAQARCARDPVLWRLDGAAHDKTYASLDRAMHADAPPSRQQWLVAEAGDALVGVAHSILLPVPPIYAGERGPPGLIMEDCHVAPEAPASTLRALLKASQDDLIAAGARVLLASSIAGGDWEAAYAAEGFVPVTRYYAKSGLAERPTSSGIFAAHADDVPGIVVASAVHRRILQDLNAGCWKPHAEADQRVEAWMQRSLTLEDRDMFVARHGAAVHGYAISQPATPLHFPAPHDIAGVGVVDDFYHASLEDPQAEGVDAEAAMLFAAAEGARARRGNDALLVVCPAAWRSKATLLHHAGYRNAMTWHIRFADCPAPMGYRPLADLRDPAVLVGWTAMRCRL